MAIIRDCGIYNFETLSLDTSRCVVLSFSILFFDMDNVINGLYDIDDLIDKTRTIKFDVCEQVNKYKREINNDTWQWWSGQDKKSQDDYLRPSPKKDKSIDCLYQFINHSFNEYVIDKSVRKPKIYGIHHFSRGNTFAPVLLENILANTGHQNPLSWHKLRDTQSFFDALLLGSKIDNNFIPISWEKHKSKNKHNKISLDVFRMQTILSANGDI